MRIFVSGGAGFIGTNLLKFLSRKYPNYQLVAVDNLSRGKKEHLNELFEHPNFEFIQLDITHKPTLQETLKAFRPQVVINAVYSDKEPEFLQLNAYGQYNLLEALRKSAPDLKKFIQLSTDEVYGESPDKKGGLHPFNEADALHPQTAIAASIAGAELLCQAYYHQHSLPTIILRLPNVFGPYQDPKHLLPLFINHALENKPLPLYGDGKHSHSWLYVQDLVQLLDKVIHYEDEKIIGEVFNVTGNLEISILEISELILAQLGKSKDLIEFISDERPHTQPRILDGSKIRSRLQWEPQSNFQEALNETINWYHAQLPP